MIACPVDSSFLSKQTVRLAANNPLEQIRLAAQAGQIDERGNVKFLGHFSYQLNCLFIFSMAAASKTIVAASIASSKPIDTHKWIALDLKTHTL